MKKDGIIKAAIYARCSTHDKGQDPELQLVPLREYCEKRGFSIAGEFVDNGISGKQERRPQLDMVIQAARKRQIDVVIVWKLDRFGRSLKHLITALDELSALGIGFISYRDNLDLSTAQGRLMFHIIGAMAEFERELIGERVKAGLDNARRKGKRIGRAPVPPVDLARIIDTHIKNPSLTIRALADSLGMKRGVVHKTLQNYKSEAIEKSDIAA